MTLKGQALRRLLEARNAPIIPGVANALGARIAENAGFEGLYLSGAGISNTNLGVPDIGLITLNDICDVVAAVRRVSSLPLIVDADTGFGNAVNTWHTARTLEQYGANAIQLEDQTYPKRCGHFDGKSVVDTSEMVEKIRAACEARTSKDFLIVARTDAAATHGLDAALRRAEAYIAAGADVTFVEAPEDIEALKLIAQLSVPQVLNMVVGGKTPPVPIEQLREMGFGMVLYANVSLQAAMLGMRLALERLRDVGFITEQDSIVATFAERQRVVGKDEYDALGKRYETAD